MGWKLWLDDQAFDAEVPARHAPEGFTAAKTSHEALFFCERFGMPEFVDFDHDLGGDDTAMKFLRCLYTKWIVDGDEIPQPFSYQIHSANLEGSLNIVSFMESWEKVTKLEEKEKRNA